jgi:transposase
MSIGPNTEIVINEYVYDPNANSGHLLATLTEGALRYVGGELSHAGAATSPPPPQTSASVAVQRRLFKAPRGPKSSITSAPSHSKRRRYFSLWRSDFGASIPNWNTLAIDLGRIPQNTIAYYIALLTSKNGQNGGVPGFNNCKYRPLRLFRALIPNRRVADSLGDSRITWGMIQSGKRRGFTMGQAIAVRTDFTAGEVRRFAKRAKDAAQARRLLAIAAVLEGASREDAAKMGGMDRQTLRDWVLRFNEQGPDGLINIPSPGMPPKLGKKHRAFLARLVEEGPIPAVDGVVRWRACDLIMRLYEEFRLSVSDDTVYRALKDLGFSHVSARPKAYKQDADAMEAFKKTLPTAWRKSVPSSRRVHL